MKPFRAHVVSLVAASLALPASSWAQGAGDRPPPGLRLHPGDRVVIEVKDEPALGGEFTVDADGSVLLPALGLVRVTDRPFPEVHANLIDGYSEQLVDPVVRITPLQRIAVVGEVVRPGLFPVDPTHTVSDMLALAGGLTPAASPRRIALVRGNETVAVRLDPTATALSIPVRSGDQVLVGRRSWLSEHSPILLGALSSVAAAAVTAIIIR